MATNLGATLRQLREQRDLTQGELAAAVGVGQAMISHLESGARQPSLPLAVKLAQVLGVSVDTLVSTLVVSQSS